MENYLKVECPKCKTILIIDRVTGKLIETREPLIKESTGDRFQDAIKKAQSSSKDVEDKFNKSKEAEKHKLQDLDNLFKKSLEEIKKEGPIKKEIRDIDLD